MALIKGLLQEAQLEPFTSGTRPAAASYVYRVIWNTSTSEAQVSDGTNWIPLGQASITNRVIAIWDAVIGSSAQVTNGAATHSTYASAIAAVSAGANVLILEGTIIENVTVTKQINFTGCGFNSFINGTITFNSSAGNSSLTMTKVGDNITVAAGANGVNIDVWLATGKTFFIDSTVINEFVQASPY